MHREGDLLRGPRLRHSRWKALLGGHSSLTTGQNHPAAPVDQGLVSSERPSLGGPVSADELTGESRIRFRPSMAQAVDAACAGLWRTHKTQRERLRLRPAPAAPTSACHPFSVSRTRRCTNQPRSRLVRRGACRSVAGNARKHATSGGACVVCLQTKGLTPAHLAPRSLGGCDHPDCVVPLCWMHHRAYDTGRLELLPHLEPVALRGRTCRDAPRADRCGAAAG